MKFLYILFLLSASTLFADNILFRSTNTLLIASNPIISTNYINQPILNTIASTNSVLVPNAPNYLVSTSSIFYVTIDESKVLEGKLNSCILQLDYFTNSSIIWPNNVMFTGDTNSISFRNGYSYDLYFSRTMLGNKWKVNVSGGFLK